MNPIRRIRARLDLTQSSLADLLGVTQGNVSLYERGQTVPPEVAKRLIKAAHDLGHPITYEDVYGPAVAGKPLKFDRRATDKVT